MICLWSLVRWRKVSWATALAFMVVVEVVVRVGWPAVGLYGSKRVLCALLWVLGGCLWSTFSIRNVQQFLSLALLVGGSPRINGSWTAVCAFVHVGNVFGRLVVADDVLPCVAPFAQHRVAIVVGEAADALDRGRLVFLYGSIQSWRAGRVGRRWGAGAVEGGRCRLRVSMRLDRGDVCHPLADTLRVAGVVWWLAQALTTLDGMTPNAFTGRAERADAARNDVTTRKDERDGCCGRLRGCGGLWPGRNGSCVRLRRAQVRGTGRRSAQQSQRASADEQRPCSDDSGRADGRVDGMRGRRGENRGAAARGSRAEGALTGSEAREHKPGESAGVRCAVSGAGQASRRRGRVCDNGAWVSSESVERQSESSEQRGERVRKKERINRA